MLSAAVSASPSIQAGMLAPPSNANANANANAAGTSGKAASRAPPAPAGASPGAGAGGAGGAVTAGPSANGGGGGDALRFEDLTIDDALPPLPRLQRYARSGIALQRLVHVKMLGEVALGAG